MMGIDTRIWIHKDDLKKLDLFIAIRLYNGFSGRWKYCMVDKFCIEDDEPSFKLKDLKDLVTFNSDVSQKSRDILKWLGDLDIIFQKDCEDKEPEGYFELYWFMHKIWDKAIEDIK